MTSDTPDGTVRRFDGFTRLGGVAVMVGLAIHILANMVLKRFPPESPTLAELKVYLAAEAPTWGLVHGMRYLAIPCLVLFVAAMYVRTCRVPYRAATGWGVVGLLGAAIMTTNLMITNGIETLAFLDFQMLSENEEIFWLLFHMTRVLFTAEIAAWALVILGFSVAGWSTATLPRWLATLGLVSATAGLLAGAFIASVLSRGPADHLVTVAGLTGMAWFLCSGVVLALHGALEARQSPGSGLPEQAIPRARGGLGPAGRTGEHARESIEDSTE